MAATTTDLTNKLDTIVNDKVAAKAATASSDPNVLVQQKISELAAQAPDFASGPVGEDAYNKWLGNTYKSLTGRWVTPNEAAVHGTYFTSPGANATAWLNEFAKYPEVEAYLKQQKQAADINNEVALSIDPQLKSLAQQREAYLQSTNEANRGLEEQYNTRMSAYDLAKSQNEEDVRAGIEDMLDRGASLLSSRGALYSGLLDESTDRTMAAKTLALGRIGQQYEADVGNLNQSYLGGQRTLAERQTLAEKQYAEDVAALQARREQLANAYLQQQEQNQMTKDQANIQTLLTLLNQIEAGRQYNANLNFQGQQVGVVPDLGTATPGFTTDQITALLGQLYNYVGGLS